MQETTSPASLALARAEDVADPWGFRGGRGTPAAVCDKRAAKLAASMQRDILTGFTLSSAE